MKKLLIMTLLAGACFTPLNAMQQNVTIDPIEAVSREMDAFIIQQLQKIGATYTSFKNEINEDRFCLLPLMSLFKDLNEQYPTVVSTLLSNEYEKPLLDYFQMIHNTRCAKVIQVSQSRGYHPYITTNPEIICQQFLKRNTQQYLKNWFAKIVVYAIVYILDFLAPLDNENKDIVTARKHMIKDLKARFRHIQQGTPSRSSDTYKNYLFDGIRKAMNRLYNRKLSPQELEGVRHAQQESMTQFIRDLEVKNQKCFRQALKQINSSGNTEEEPLSENDILTCYFHYFDTIKQEVMPVTLDEPVLNLITLTKQELSQ